MTGPRLARIRDEERGAVLLIVALCLLILLGMLVLTVDLGRGVAYKRQLVNGADAAALAAAQQCALGNGSNAARSAGLQVVRENVDLSNPRATFTMPQCDNPTDSSPHSVTVVANADIDYYFAPVFGFSGDNVAARAVAIWGPVAKTNPVPITVDNQQLLNCGIVQGDPPKDDVNCDLSYPKDALQEPRWGVLDLSHWGDPDAAPCSVDAATLKNIIVSGGWPGDPLPENNYDCLDNGLAFDVWSTMVGRVLTFPVIDVERSTGLVKPSTPPLGGTDCTGADIPALRAEGYDCEIDTAYVIGFISLLVNSVVNNGSTVEVDTTFLGSTTGNGIPCLPEEDCADFGLRAVRLVE